MEFGRIFALAHAKFTSRLSVLNTINFEMQIMIHAMIISKLHCLYIVQMHLPSSCTTFLQSLISQHVYHQPIPKQRDTCNMQIKRNSIKRRFGPFLTIHNFIPPILYPIRLDHQHIFPQGESYPINNFQMIYILYSSFILPPH